MCVCLCRWCEVCWDWDGDGTAFRGCCCALWLWRGCLESHQYPLVASQTCGLSSVQKTVSHLTMPHLTLVVCLACWQKCLGLQCHISRKVDRNVLPYSATSHAGGVWHADRNILPYSATSHTGGVTGLLTTMSHLIVLHLTPLLVCPAF